MTLKEAKRELQVAGIPPHLCRLALQRLRALNAFWAAGAATEGRDLTRTRARVAEELRAKFPGTPVSRASIRDWESMFRQGGVVALARRNGAWPRATKRTPANTLERMELADLADYAIRVVNVLASRAKREVSAGDVPGPCGKGRRVLIGHPAVEINAGSEPAS